MMKPFLGADFLLETETAKRLYEVAARMPIIDYHCHLSIKEIYADKRFNTLTEIWLGGDHYKWRALRAMGVSETLITGTAPDYEKFMAWAKVVPYLIGNPLYHWTHLELQRFFGINTLLDETTAKAIYDAANAQLVTLTARQLILKSNVNYIFTTDDPLDDLKEHRLLAKDKTFPVDVRPAFRPDKAVNIELSWFKSYIESLSAVVKFPINNLDQLEAALLARIHYFNDAGCRASDHALDEVLFAPATRAEVDVIFQKALSGASLTRHEVSQYKGHLMVFFGRVYNRLGWVQQYHIGALRNINQWGLKTLGPDTGYDAINDALVARPLADLLSALAVSNELPKTILYCLNPRDNEMLATIMACFQGEVAGKLQFGSAWWFNDQKDGMERQLEALCQNGLLSQFVGMLTDSRSFLSYPRHEYFRRILCNKIGHLVESGQYPNNTKLLTELIENICYHNAIKYFGVC